MLLRSSSAPILSSLLHYSKDSSSPESEPILQLPRRTISFISLSQNMLDIDVHNTISSPKKRCCVPHSKVTKNQLICTTRRIKEKDIEVKKFSHEKSTCMEEENPSIQVLTCCGGYSGRGSDGGGHGRRREFSNEENNNHGRDKTDSYYKNMIEAYPNDSLLLANYAKFLNEVCEDYPRAKEYFERAILATPCDGHILSLYADLIWKTEKNLDRAEGYFDQAIQSASNDCYVMASYAKFLWEAEEEGEEEEEEEDDDGVGDKDCPKNCNNSYTHLPEHDNNDHLFQGTNYNHHTHLTAAS